MKKNLLPRVVGIVVLGGALAVSCVAPSPEGEIGPLPGGKLSATESATPSGEEDITPSPEGEIGPLSATESATPSGEEDITPSPEGETGLLSGGKLSATESATPSGEDGSVSSSGEFSEESPPSGPIAIPSGPTEPPPSEEDIMDWEVYRDDTYGYEIRYPPDFVTLGGTQEQEPQPLQQVRFQDQVLASSDTASLEPPKFSIEVFDNSSQLSIEQWLEENAGLQGGMKFELEPYSLAGIQGVRASTPLLLAPREHIYLPKGSYVFKLTPLGRRAEQMLTTFEFTK